ncbi:DUF4328 domain-containing protein [Myceligenerans pegani]|uniref:DUF4328 domain-containing protein n=1 Tax=Myceligenerans pegani TaxID=2776917 RepID=A0ABR9MTI5_9MICO|nr:DUF4328 domain-containing protein [Myceligenerans sp. TRM 65318]MBE1874680.1 DUF4328 domain-containing protein [Myceligenerans sp. TRM 65318]MBE3016951.1 DUF4328 domain-containing protein [Myceligenerans sp. TRM 65318]
MPQQPPHQPPYAPQPGQGGPDGAGGTGPVAGDAGLFAPPVANAGSSPNLTGLRTARAQPAGPGHGYPMVRPRVPAGSATAATALAIAYAAVRLVMAVLSIPAAAVWADAADQGLTYADAEYVAYDIVGILLLPLTVAIFVVGSLWLYESRKFAESVNPAYRHRRGAVWAWLGWVVPVVSLWFPYLVVADVRRATIRNKLMAGMGGWWACWLIVLFLDQITTSLTGGALGTAPLTSAVGSYPVFEGLAAVLTGIACWLWVAMIRELAAAQREWEVTPIA